MYTGTLINELIATVERTETRILNANADTELERWYAGQTKPVLVEADLLGVA
jgi:hypothetical protein